MSKTDRKAQKTQCAKQTAIRTHLGSPHPKLHRIADGVRIALIAASVGTPALSMKAYALTCPITSLVTLSTTDTNASLCEITAPGQLDIIGPGGTLNNSGTLNNMGALNNFSGTLNNSGTLSNRVDHGAGVINNAGTLNNSGTLYNRYPSYLNNTGTLNNQTGGLLDNSSYGFHNSGTLNNQSGATLRHSHGLINQSGGTLNNDGTMTNQYWIWNEAGGTIVNSGLFEGSGGIDLEYGLWRFSPWLHNWGVLTNNGTLSHNSVTNEDWGTLNNTATGTLTTVYLRNDAVLNNAGILNNPYTGVSLYDGGILGRLKNIGTLHNQAGGALNNGGSIENSGTLDNQAGGTLNIDGDINNDGSISNTGDFDIASTGTVTGSGDFTQTAGSTIVDGSLNQGSVSFSGGTLGGQGIVTSHGIPGVIDPGATVNPGNTIAASPGDFTGTLTFGSDVSFDGAMTIELAGLTDFDTLDVLNSIDFGLNSQITFDLEGYLPSVGDSLTFLFSNSLTRFDNITYNFLDPLPGLNHDVVLTPDNNLSLEFSAVLVPTNVVASVLPTSRSVQVGNVATAFATIINTDSTTATDCGIAPQTSVQADFAYQTTDASNALIGTANTPVDIDAGGDQSYVFAFTPTASFGPVDVQLAFDCTNTDPAPVTVGLNTLLLVADSGPVPDIVALGATLTGDGIVNLENNSGVFAVATVNVGNAGSINVSADTGSASLPVSIALCETNPATGVCINPTVPTTGTVTTSIAAGATPTFAFFVTSTGSVPFDPANNRIFVRFQDAGGVTRGSTSVAVRTL